jgi:hypothetical protein
MMDPFSPTIVGFFLFLVVCFGIAAIYGAVRKRKEMRRSAAPKKTASSSMGLRSASSNNRDGSITPQTQTRVPTLPLSARKSSGDPIAFPPILRTLVMIAAIISFFLLVIVFMPASCYTKIRSTLTGQTEPDEPFLLEKLAEERLPGQFRIFGTVRYVGKEELNDAQVVLKIYGEDGSLMDTVAAPLKNARLTGQSTSEFSFIYVPGAHTISRYAVSFKKTDGSLIPHRDMRGATQP